MILVSFPRNLTSTVSSAGTLSLSGRSGLYVCGSVPLCERHLLDFRLDTREAKFSGGDGNQGFVALGLNLLFHRERF